MSARYDRPGIAGPVVLIGLGVVFLMNNLGLLAWSVWEVILRLWPLLFVAWGLDLMVGRRSAWGVAITLIIVLALFSGGVAMMGNARSADGSVVVIDLPLENTHRAQITLDPGLAYLRLKDADIPGKTLLSGRVQPLKGERVDHEVFRNDGWLEAVVRTRGGIMLPFLPDTTDRASWEFSLHPEIEYDLRIDVGGGKTDLLIGDLKVAALEVHNGVGETIIYLPVQGDYHAEIDGGIGHILIYLPDDVGFRLSMDVGIGSIDVPMDFRREGGDYISPGYDMAEQHIEVSVSLGIGSIEVR
jgi:hypothetical protein